jgi:NAD(P)H-dependent flavin oxidoreductase YrpB (nitropropane dioxygenase family)
VLALGAQAAWLGTRFLLAEEMPIHGDYRRALIAAAETDPQWYPDLYDVGWPDSPHRALRNSTARAWEAAARYPESARGTAALLGAPGGVGAGGRVGPQRGVSAVRLAGSLSAGLGLSLGRRWG